ncbi:MAG: hypothetical protein Q4F72_01875, partial [Desulfovibrionaceae bacterium]|nr:hypothetical protein [Desulfovibrionaceae bacterium]
MTAELAGRALAPDCLNAEQAGFVDTGKRTLRMAGGEFCVNATRAFGAMLDMVCAGTGDERRFEVTVSGWPGAIALSVTGAAPEWTVTAELALGQVPVESPAEGLALVRLPGISHLLAGPNAGGMPPAGARKAAARTLLEQHGLLGEPAAGVIWWTPESGARDGACGIAICPVVRVR